MYIYIYKYIYMHTYIPICIDIYLWGEKETQERHLVVEGGVAAAQDSLLPLFEVASSLRKLDLGFMVKL